MMENSVRLRKITDGNVQTIIPRPNTLGTHIRVVSQSTFYLTFYTFDSGRIGCRDVPAIPHSCKLILSKSTCELCVV